MDDDGDMAEMYLSEKKLRTEASFYGDQSMLGYNSVGDGTSFSAPVSPVSSPTESRKLEKAFSLCRSRHDSVKSSDNTATEHIQELEMLLEAYFVVIDSTLNKLTSVMNHLSPKSQLILFFITSSYRMSDLHFLSAEGVHWWHWRFYQHSVGKSASLLPSSILPSPLHPAYNGPIPTYFPWLCCAFRTMFGTNWSNSNFYSQLQHLLSPFLEWLLGYLGWTSRPQFSAYRMHSSGCSSSLGWSALSSSADSYGSSSTKGWCPCRWS